MAARPETDSARTLVLDVAGWPGHMAGQRLDLRLTAEDGYRAIRNYSIASAPGDSHVELTVQRTAGGEVSPYLVDVVVPGDSPACGCPTVETQRLTLALPSAD